MFTLAQVATTAFMSATFAPAMAALAIIQMTASILTLIYVIKANKQREKLLDAARKQRELNAHAITMTQTRISDDNSVKIKKTANSLSANGSNNVQVING